MSDQLSKLYGAWLLLMVLGVQICLGVALTLNPPWWAGFVLLLLLGCSVLFDVIVAKAFFK